MSEPRKSPAQRFVELRQELQKLEYFCKGTILARTMKCGQPGCACHTEPARRHGPYWEWTYKAQNKTVNVRLDPAVGPLYKSASPQYRRLKFLLRRLEKASHSALLVLAKQEAPKPKNELHKRSPPRPVRRKH
jgi:hypothetical protein